jgi:hypothetical protein
MKVYIVNINGHKCVEPELTGAMNHVRNLEIDDSLTITKEQMDEEEYNNLEECEGF